MVRIPHQTKERKNMIENLTSNTFNEAWIASVWKKLIREVAFKTYNTHLPLTAEDIASKAITYTLKPGINGTGEFPTSEKQLLRTARKIAKWAIIDAVKKANKMLECESTIQGKTTTALLRKSAHTRPNMQRNSFVKKRITGI